MSRDQSEQERISSQYQDLLRREIAKFRSVGENFQNPDSFLVDKDLNGIALPELVERGLVVSFPGNRYRTSHMDLVFRLVQIRNRQTTEPIPLEFRLEQRDEPVPDFGANDFADVLNLIIPPGPNKALVSKALISAFHRAGLVGLSSYQFPLVQELASGKSRDVAIVAPTASGKTLTFFFPVLLRAIQRRLSKSLGVSSVLVYPRKALGRDQMQTFLRLVDAVNENLRVAGFDIVSVGIDDSDTPRKKWLVQGESYRRLRCVAAGCSGELIISTTSSKALVVCGRCRKEYDYITPSKEDVWEKKPSILITNLYIVYRRLMSSRSLHLFENLDFVVIDEAHVYTNFLGGHIHHILKMLKHVAELGSAKPVFVYSSATIPNPVQFISELAGVSQDRLHYISFHEALSRISGLRKRMMLHLYLLPHPSSNIETMTEALILAVSLWCHRLGMKSITFIDSVAEINTMTDYIHTTILGKREGREVTDHLFETDPKSLDNDYYWYSLAPSNTRDNFAVFRAQVLDQIKDSIGMHYGGLPVADRAKLETEFKAGSKRMLLSTSTLELGIDLSDVACIIQHKLPVTPEGVVQRVGRSGRSSACYRIALGIVALPTLPLSTLYIYNNALRERLESVSHLPPLRVGMASHNIGLQYTLSELLLMRALEGRSTYLDADSGSLSTEAELVEAVKQLMLDLPKVVGFNNSSKILSEDVLTTQLANLSRMMEIFERGYRKLQKADRHGGESETISHLRSLVEAQISKIVNVSDELTGLRRLSDNVDLFSDSIGRFQTIHEALDDARSRLIELSRSVRWASENRDPSIVHKWELQHLEAISATYKALPTSDDISELVAEWISKIRQEIGSFQKFRQIYGIDFSQITKLLTSIGTELGFGEKDDVISFLSKIPLILKGIRNVDFDIMDAREATGRFVAEVKATGYPLDIFEALSLVFEGRAYFSLLLETPAPDFELVGVDDA